MDDVDKTLESLKVQIKKEIVDNYFADRVYLEEDLAILHQEVQSYAREVKDILAKRFMALYQALGSRNACGLMMEILGQTEWPFYQEYCDLPPKEQHGLLKDIRPRGLTAYRRFRNLIFSLYEDLQLDSQRIHETYEKIQTHLKLLNEDIDKFNLSHDFGLIAAQIEALEGSGPSMAGGLLALEREELSTRMRFKRVKMTDAELLPVPALPPIKEVKGQLDDLLLQIYKS